MTQKNLPKTIKVTAFILVSQKLHDDGERMWTDDKTELDLFITYRRGAAATLLYDPTISVYTLTASFVRKKN